MNRLTYKVKMGNGKERVSFHCADSFAETAQILADKLADYETLEEQRMLLKLPVPLNSLVYIAGTKCLSGAVCPDLQGCDDCLYDREYTVFERYADLHFVVMLVLKNNENFIFGKTVFLTKEEAEKALAEMGTNNE